MSNAEHWNAEELKRAGFRRILGSNGVYVRMMGTQMEIASTQRLGYFKSVDWDEDEVPVQYLYDAELDNYDFTTMSGEWEEWVDEKAVAIAGDRNIMWRRA